MLTFIAFVFFIIGFLNIFAKDLMWSLTTTGGPLEGLPNEQNASWNRWTTLVGVVAILIAVGFWYYS